MKGKVLIRIKNLRQKASFLLFDPIDLYHRWKGIPWFLMNLINWKRLNQDDTFKFRWVDAMFTSFERFSNAGSVGGHYFYQDIWAAQKVYESGIADHVDVGSRLDGFVAHILPFCHVEFIDMRPLADIGLPNLIIRRGSILSLPYLDASIQSLSCLHVIEHIGLGRYGDLVDPEGHIKAAYELGRVLKPGGTLLLATPVGRQRLCFDAHRVFDPATVTRIFGALTLKGFWLIDDSGSVPKQESNFDNARLCHYGCGLFEFTKK